VGERSDPDPTIADVTIETVRKKRETLQVFTLQLEKRENSGG
jgi:hypothetical protein